MEMFRSLLCCCGSNRGRERIDNDYDYIKDEDLLLPGELQWDKVSKSFRKSTSPNSHKNGNAYVPPRVPDTDQVFSGSVEVPKIEDFKLLRTVGKGAFGKVRDILAMYCQWPLIPQAIHQLLKP